jgi:cytochrome c peroxidase
MARRFRPATRLIVAALIVLFVAIAVRGLPAAQELLYTCVGGFTEEVAPPVFLSPLSGVENPVIPIDPLTGKRVLREDLVEYVANLEAAIRLGKAFFWDMQAGSDNKTTCATCHFHGGQDGRTRNLLNPGANGQWDYPTHGPNVDIWAGAFPFTTEGGDTDNIAGSQGVRMSLFGGLSKAGVEQLTYVSDPVFNVGGRTVRQVTGRTAPSVINAVFNHRNFHDGRAQAEFNGVNPFGNRDAAARVWFVGPLGPTQIDIHINDASLASQAVGPVLSGVEMSGIGRTFPDVGKKLLALKPLGLQQVSAGDSILGSLATSTTGLNTTYKAMVQAAFKPKWWNTTKTVRVGSKSYTMMEANTALFWGLSVMLYQATLVADQTPMDRYLAARALGDPNAGALLDDVAVQMSAELGQPITRANLIAGLALFELPPPPAPGPNGAGCMLCHVGAELTSASSRNLNHGIEADDVAFVNAGFEQRLERMFWRIPPLTPGSDKIALDMAAWTVTEYNTTDPSIPSADVPLAVYDAGYYNIGVRPTADDVGSSGFDPWGISLSIVRMLQQTIADPSYIKVPGAALNCGVNVVRNPSGFPLLSGPLRKTERTLVDGAFKVPGLRNVELTAPYMHNGGKSTLFQVMEFYDDGGDFANEALAPLIKPLHLQPEQIRDLIAFMVALTDERVRLQKAPFDHPQLFVPDGHRPDGSDNTIEIPAVGAAGGTPLRRFLNLNPFGQ